MAGPAPPRRRGLRVLGCLGVLLLLGGGAAVAAPLADSALKAAAQERVAAELRRTTGTTGALDVTVGGGWFVPQVLAGEYPDVVVVARQVPVPGAEGLALDRVAVRLDDVTLPVSDVLDGDVEQVVAGRSRVRAELGYPALNAYLAAAGRPLSVAPGDGGDGLVVTGYARVLGQDVALSADVELQVTGGRVQAVPQQLQTGNRLLDRLSRSVLSGLRDDLAFTVPLEELPFQQQLTQVQVDPGGLVVTAEGTRVAIGIVATS